MKPFNKIITIGMITLSTFIASFAGELNEISLLTAKNETRAVEIISKAEGMERPIKPREHVSSAKHRNYILLCGACYAIRVTLGPRSLAQPDFLKIAETRLNQRLDRDMRRQWNQQIQHNISLAAKRPLTRNRNFKQK
ncbi:MAG: hypothetical protein AAF212_07810 [Verrucomicrobiota bacterium]